MLSPATVDDNDSSTTPLERIESSGSRSQAHSHSHSYSQSHPPSRPHTHGPSHSGAAPTPGTSSVWGLGDPHPTPSHHLSSEASTSPAESWRLDEFVTDPGYLAYQEELRCLIFNTAQTAAPTREGTPEAADGGFAAGGFAAPATSRGDDSTARRLAGQVLGTGRRLEYLKNYVGEVAPWLDMFDSDRAFGIQVPVLARSSPALLYAVLALSARQMERKEGTQTSFDSLELYQEAIRLLTPLLQSRDQKIIPICTILCCLEMMSASAQDWRKHLEGCAALFDSFSVHGFSGGLLQAVFWCYARMDLCGALISDGTENTLLAPSKWLPTGASHDDARRLFRESGSPDMHANYAVYLCARVCELVADRTRHFELGGARTATAATPTAAADDDDPAELLTTRWVRLWEDLQAWTRERPAELLPAQSLQSSSSSSGGSPFPQILFLHWAAISSNQLYHTACALLLGSMPRPPPTPGPGIRLGVAGSAVWHAKRICGISLANPHQGCLNNAIQPLWVAGRLLSHRSEHALLVRLIRSIEAVTGWGTCWRIDDLEAAWGYKLRKELKVADVVR
ncbi:Transcription activator AMTR1 [Colletotrichum sidae]|uniref:Transcription activator AMTR1 n=1 Tax=Colletotrichum sidae TaxID=1347389 RepID=A0A4R8TBZ4_9PEZI|nr:Transcription activator AMTR1 [Colletotrichum sidae]